MPNPSLFAASAVLCAAALACGGSGSPTASPSASPTTTTPSPTPSGLTKAEWVTQINKLCLELEKETDKIGEPETAQEFADALKTLVAEFDEAQAKARTYAPPPEDAAEIEAKFYASNEAQTAALRAAIPDIEAAAQAKDEQAAARAFGEALGASLADAEDSEKWMKEYGLTDCV